MARRRFTAAAMMALLALGACSREEPAKSYAVEDVPLSQISADLAAGKTTAVEITESYIERIKTYDAPLKAVIMIAPDALQQAAASDRRRKDGKAIGPMDGIPILLKDNIDAKGMPTTAGSYALEHNIPTQDADLTRRLREAGAVILGKVNTNQFAGLRTTQGLLGSTVGGMPHNPYDLARTPAGSSNGSGIAAAVSFSAATVGTCTTGSVIGPASLMGLVSMRPTIALISRGGIVPISLGQDTAGPMARNVTDAAMMMNIMAGTEARDPASAEADAHKTDYVKALSIEGLKGQKIGVIRGMSGYSEVTKPLFEEAVAVLAAQGAELVDIPADIFEDLSQEQRVILVYDFKQDLNAYLAASAPAQQVRTMTDLVAFNKADPRENMWSQDLVEAAEATTGRDNPEYVNALAYAKKKAGPEGYDRAFAYGVVAVVTPTGQPAGLIPPPGTPGHTISERPKGSSPPSPSMYAALAGYPNLTVPMGQVEGLPVGLSFIGPKWSEAALLSMAYAYEQASHKRMPPTAYKQAIAAK
ncbi:MAG: amidase [Proteobacteria bacterium]|nr:amidase [Pseudomonadota bacterium]